MKKPELFHKTVGILAKAYLKGELDAEDCTCCAVGNLVAANLDYIIEKKVPGDLACNWRDSKGFSQSPEWRVWFWDNENFHEARLQIQSTGYTALELENIEMAFMSARVLSYNIDYVWEYDNFEGMMRVVDYLIELHEANQEDIQEAKNKFVKV